MEKPGKKSSKIVKTNTFVWKREVKEKNWLLKKWEDLPKRGVGNAFLAFMWIVGLNFCGNVQKATSGRRYQIIYGENVNVLTAEMQDE